MGADSHASPGGWLASPDPDPYSEYSDEHPDDTLRSADPSWPARVRDAWESFRQARARVSALIDACDQLQEEQAPRHSVAVVAQRASNAVREADTAYDVYAEEWHA
jgi:broad specificity phosphatase PhoE